MTRYLAAWRSSPPVATTSSLRGRVGDPQSDRSVVTGAGPVVAFTLYPVCLRIVAESTASRLVVISPAIAWTCSEGPESSKTLTLALGRAVISFQMHRNPISLALIEQVTHPIGTHCSFLFLLVQVCSFRYII